MGNTLTLRPVLSNTIPQQQPVQTAAPTPQQPQQPVVRPPQPIASKRAPSLQELQAQLQQLQQENQQLKQQKASGGVLSLKVSDKGAVQCNGLGRFPTTLYDSQWYRVGTQAFGLSHEEFQQSPIGRFIADNYNALSHKEEK